MSPTLFVSTLVAPAGAALSDSDIASVGECLAQSGAKIDKTARLDNRAADIFFLSNSLPLAGRIREGGTQQQFPQTFDILTQPAATRRKKILVADMESTIIEQEMLDELAAQIGIGEKTAEITRMAMNGELDFAAALKERVNLLKGQPASLLDEVSSRMTLSPGAQTLIDAMKRAGGKSWLVSGGFTFFVKKIAEQSGFDRFFANELKVKNGLITGEVALPILDKNSKKDLLDQACAEYGCTLAESMAVGDGANDVPMLQSCNGGGGLGVAYRAKPKVREIIAHQINHSDLSALAYAQGFH